MGNQSPVNMHQFTTSVSVTVRPRESSSWSTLRSSNQLSNSRCGIRQPAFLPIRYGHFIDRSVQAEDGDPMPIHLERGSTGLAVLTLDSPARLNAYDRADL